MKDFLLWLMLLGMGLVAGVFIGVLLSLAVSLHIPSTWVAVFVVLTALAVIVYDVVSSKP